MNYEDFDKLKVMYTQLIELVCRGKEADTEDENMDCFFKMFQIVRACLEFSPYTHFYTQVLIDLIVKTYNFKHIEQIYYLNLKLVFLLIIQNILQKNFINK